MLSNTVFHANIKQDCLYQEPVIIRVTQFNDLGLKSFTEDFQKALHSYQSIIPIVVDSYGGEVYSLLAMIDIIKHSSVPVATFVSSKAMSCGAVLFSCGTPGHRYISDNAYILIHQVSGGAWGKVEEVKVSTEHMQELNENLLEILSKNCGKKKDFFKKLIHKNDSADIYIDSKYAIELGLADTLGTPSFKVSIEQKVELK